MKKYNTKLHILHTESIYSRGGEKYLFELLNKCSKKITVHLYLHKISKKWLKQYEDENIHVTKLWSPKRFFWVLLPVTLFTNYLQLRSKIKQSDVVFATNFPMNFLAVLASKKTICHCFEPLAIFYDPIRIASLSRFSQFCVKIAKYFCAPLDKWAYKKAKIMTTLAPSVVPYILSVYHRKPDIYLPNGVDYKFFQSKIKLKRNNSIQKLGHSTDYTIFKGTEDFLHILVQLKNYTTNFVALISESITDDKIKKIYNKFIKLHNLEKYVIFTGNLSETQLSIFYRDIDVFIYTGSVDSAGGSTASLSVLEAQSCGTPVIRSHGDDHEIVPNVTGKYINPHLHQEAAKIIFKFLELSINKKTQMGKQAREYIKNKYSWNYAANTLVKISNDLL